MLEAKSEDGADLSRQNVQQRFERIEAFIGWLLDIGCLLEATLLKEKHEREQQDDLENFSVMIEAVLGEAVSHASYDIVSRLIAKGANVYARQKWYGEYFFAIEYGENVTALHIAALSWNIEAIKALLDHRGNVADTDMVSLPDNEGRLPLHWALAGVASNYADIIDLDKVTLRMEDTVKLLLAVKLDTVYVKDQHCATAFHYAVNNNTGYRANIKAIRLLVHANQLPDTLIARNNLGVTALGEAMEPYRFVTDGLGRLAEILEILLENGADARACDRVSRNALHKLSSFSWQGSISPSIIDRLLDLLDINDSDNNSRTELYYLVKNLDQVDAVCYLVSQGADVNAVD